MVVGHLSRGQHLSNNLTRHPPGTQRAIELTTSLISRLNKANPQQETNTHFGSVHSGLTPYALLGL